MTQDEKRQIAAEYLGHLLITFLEKSCVPAQQDDSLGEYSPPEPSEKEIDAAKREILKNKIEVDRHYLQADLIGILGVCKTTLQNWRKVGFLPEHDGMSGQRRVWHGETVLSWLEWREEFGLSCPADLNSEVTPFSDWA